MRIPSYREDRHSAASLSCFLFVSLSSVVWTGGGPMALIDLDFHLETESLAAQVRLLV